MKRLVVIAHGSRRKAANQQVLAWIARLTVGLQQDYQRVYGAFLELAEPAMDDVLREAGQDVRQVDVLPYFLASGSHVTTDIPRALERARQANPDTCYRQLPAVGELPGFVDFVASSLRAS